MQAPTIRNWGVLSPRNMPNLTRVSLAPKPQVHAYFDIKTLGTAELDCLRYAIKFRNAPTGAGTFLTFSKDLFKLKAAALTSMNASIEGLLLRLEMGQGNSSEGIRLLVSSSSQIEKYILRLNVEFIPLRNAVLAEVHEVFPQAINDPEFRHRPQFIAEVMKRIGPAEQLALGYIRLIDIEIDKVLGLFGLTKDSTI